jgi:Autotransporter beta-domain
MKTAGSLRYCRALAASAALLPALGGGLASPAKAQIFCPTSTSTGASGIVLSGGFCTNGGTGALSTAALSSQSLSEVTQTTTQQSTLSTLEAVEKRRAEEVQRCPEGSERTAQGCRRIAQRTTAPSSTPAPSSSRATMVQPRAPSTTEQPAEVTRRTTARTRTAPAPTPLYKAPPMIYESVRYASWVQGFGDYERRTGTGFTSGGVIGGLGTGSIPVDLGRKASTLGFNGGLDATFRNSWWAGDILIAGLVSGYVSTDINYSATSLKARIEGPSVGAYATYLSGPFSTDFVARVEFMHIDETFTDLLNFNLGASGGTALASGSASTNVNNYVVAGNLNYRWLSTPYWWLEPTVGFRFIQSSFDNSAAALGLADGHDWRVQGGARIGTDFYWGTVHVTPTLTGLAYEDVDVTGGVVTGGLFPASPIIPSDQGKVRGQGIFATNFDYGTGFSTFLLAEVRGGQDLFAAGGRAGIRYQW